MTRDHRPRGAELAAQGRIPAERVALVDLLDRLLAGGVVVSGDLVLSIADVDLVRISLRALITSVWAIDPVPSANPPGTVTVVRTSGATAPAKALDSPDQGFPR
ncbi:gas vesicle protein [Streptosporangium amethystogenes]|uniref:gas vesicle protein n=1 Tax=Streptosporangium amethystogenes TaxID=2002 RepID=UPI000565CB4C|nr:gas vesicle protein [Streptosporangium amethystogenes]